MAFKYIECGGLPSPDDNHDYEPFLPLLLKRYDADTLPLLKKYSSAAVVSKYLALDFKAIQQQVRDELQVQKLATQGSAPIASRSAAFERGTPETRARIALLEIHRLLSLPHTIDQAHASTVFNDAILKDDFLTLVPILVLQCELPAINVKALVRTLVYVPRAEKLVTAIIANNPTEFHATIEMLLTIGSIENARASIYSLCVLAHHRVQGVRERLVRLQTFPDLAIQLTMEFCSDQLCFLNRILKDQPEWLATVDPVTKPSLSTIMDFIFASLATELEAGIPNTVTISRTLRILSGMIGLLSLDLTVNQLDMCLDVMEMDALPSTVNPKICLALVAASQLIKRSKSRLSAILLKLLAAENSPQVLLIAVYSRSERLAKIDEFVSRALRMQIVIPRLGLIEMRSLFSSIFSDRQLSTCALALGRSTRALVSLTEPGSVSTLCVCQLLQENVFQRSGVDVREWIFNRIVTATIPLDISMLPLLKAFATANGLSSTITRIPEQDILNFFKSTVDIQPGHILLALYMLLNNENCATLLTTDPSKIVEYPSSFLEAIRIRRLLLHVQTYKGGVPYKLVQPMFLKLMTAQFPELFGVITLLIEEALDRGISSSASLSKPIDGTSLIPSIERVLVTVRPEVCLQIISRALEDPNGAVRAFHQLQNMPEVQLISQCRPILETCLPLLLDPTCSPLILDAFKKTWDILNRLLPHDLWAMTINCLRVREREDSRHMDTAYSFEWFVQDPLLAFRVDFRVFRCPAIFRLFLQILGSIMEASKHRLRKLFFTSQAFYSLPPPPIPGGPKNTPLPRPRKAQPTFKETNLNAMLYIQDSALLQLLLEVCRHNPKVDGEPVGLYDTGAMDQDIEMDEVEVESPRRKRRKSSRRSMLINTTTASATTTTTSRVSPLDEIRVIIFNFLHQIFIDHKIVPKLLHFQGYEPDLLAIAVPGIWSIHICLDFVHEIISALPNPLHAPAGVLGGSANSSLSKYYQQPLFGLLLAAHLCLRYPLQSTHQMMNELILPKLLELAVCTKLCAEVLSAAKTLCRAFPGMQSDIVEVLQEAARQLQPVTTPRRPPLPTPQQQHPLPFHPHHGQHGHFPPPHVPQQPALFPNGTAGPGMVLIDGPQGPLMVMQEEGGGFLPETRAIDESIAMGATKTSTRPGALQPSDLVLDFIEQVNQDLEDETLWDKSLT